MYLLISVPSSDSSVYYGVSEMDEVTINVINYNKYWFNINKDFGNSTETNRIL